MNPTLISQKKARQLALVQQGLNKKNAFGKGKKGTLEFLNHISYVQIDTLSVVVRAHHHTCWSRVPGYQQAHLNQLLEEQKVFEYWSHAASYLPMNDYRFSLHRKQRFLEGQDHWFKRDDKVMKYVLDRIKNEGPQESKDFESLKHKPGPWYSWKPAKKALEQLFMEGTLMVAKRNGFRKVYDLTERILPNTIDTTVPTTAEMCRFLINTSIKTHGIATDREMVYLRKGLKPTLLNELKSMQESGAIVAVQVKDTDGTTYYTHPKMLESKAKIAKNVSLLSPFDNAVIQRKRLSLLFDFDYQIECYVPEPKRKYGYFSLPILWGDEFIGRMDAKADRKKGVFIVKNLVFEPNFCDFDEVLSTLANEIKAFALFDECNDFEIKKVDPARLGIGVELKKLLR
jgi:uncharacterized protein YcaQ